MYRSDWPCLRCGARSRRVRRPLDDALWNARLLFCDSPESNSRSLRDILGAFCGGSLVPWT